MRRGTGFENELNKLAEYLNLQGVHMHKNNALRSFKGAYLEGEPFDYEVIANGRFHCFDAKECAGKRWNLHNAKPTQVYHLLNCVHNGAEAYFLVKFKLTNNIIRFDVDLVQQALNNGKKSLTEKDGVIWKWTELAVSKKDTI